MEMKWYPPELRGRVFVVDIAPLGTLLACYFSEEVYEGMPEARDSSDDGMDNGDGDEDDAGGEKGDEDVEDEDGEEVRGQDDGEWVGNRHWKP